MIFFHFDLLKSGLEARWMSCLVLQNIKNVQIHEKKSVQIQTLKVESGHFLGTPFQKILGPKIVSPERLGQF